MVWSQNVGHLRHWIADEYDLLLLTRSWRRGGNLLAARPALAITSGDDSLPVDNVTAIEEYLVRLDRHIRSERLASGDLGIERSTQNGSRGLNLHGRLGEAGSCERKP